MKEKGLHKVVMGGLLASLLLGAWGCGEAEPAVSDKTKGEQNQLEDIRSRTGYDWSKATDADKKFLTDTCHGDENCAKMLLFRPKPGGPTRRPTPGGPPPGPPTPGGG